MEGSRDGIDRGVGNAGSDGFRSSRGTCGMRWRPGCRRRSWRGSGRRWSSCGRRGRSRPSDPPSGARHAGKERLVTAPKPLSKWQEDVTPSSLPRHIRRNIGPGDGGCWLWLRSRSRDGYGWASLGNKTFQAHRLVYELIRGSVPAGLVLDHLCRVRNCVNPDHLQPVTPRENLVRSELTPAGMSVCKQGHEFQNKGGQRRCLICLTEYLTRTRNIRIEYLRNWHQRQKTGSVRA
ncbi:HNH endonuclease signature motif containing protein [Methyloversatilis universalis]|uniref:HNH endonuclease signature motif containing protein n=2 Tax=Methyloversatilis universalis TaxID=378211 RepID=UPI0009DA0E8D